MKKKIIFIVLIAIIFLASGIYYFYFFNNHKNIKGRDTEKQLENFKIYIPSSRNLINKEVYSSKEESDLKKVEKIIELFIGEMPSPYKETKILGVYRDRENIIYIDLSKDFCAPADAMQEYLLLKAFYRTLKDNANWIKDIRILIDSREKENLAGHVAIDNYLKESLEEH